MRWSSHSFYCSLRIGDELYLALRLSEEGTTTPTYYQFQMEQQDKTHYLVDKIVGPESKPRSAVAKLLASLTAT